MSSIRPIQLMQGQSCFTPRLIWQSFLANDLMGYDVIWWYLYNVNSCDMIWYCVKVLYDLIWMSININHSNHNNHNTRTRRGGSCLRDIYKTILIYRTCMRRAPAKLVRACILRKWCPVSHVTFEAPLRTSHFSLHSSHSTLHTPHVTLHTALFGLHTSLYTALLRLHTSHSTLHTSQSTLLTSHCFLHTPHFTLRTPHFTLHSSRPTLHTALFTLHTSSHLSSSHLIPAHLRRHSDKKSILKHFLKGLLKGKFVAPKFRKSADKSLSQPWCNHSNTIYEIQLQKTIVLRMQPRHQATLTQPLQCVSPHHVANLHGSTHMATPDYNNHAAIPMRSATTDSRNA